LKREKKKTGIKPRTGGKRSERSLQFVNRERKRGSPEGQFSKPSRWKKRRRKRKKDKMAQEKEKDRYRGKRVKGSKNGKQK